MKRQIPWILRTAFRAAPVEAVLNLTSGLMTGLGPAAMLLQVKRLIDAVAAGARPAELAATLVWLAAILLLMAVGNAILPVTNNRVQEKVRPFVQGEVLAKAATLSLAQFDTAETHDVIERASDNGPRVGMQFTRLTSMLSGLTQVVSAVGIIASASVWLAMLAGLVAVPIAWAGVRQGQRWHTMWHGMSAGRRRSYYLSGLLSDRQSATEIRAFQLGRFFLDRWLSVFRPQQAEEQRTQWQGAREGALADLAGLTLFVGTLVSFAFMARTGGLGAGSVVALASAVRLLRGGMTLLAQQLGSFWENGLPIGDLLAFLALKGEEPAGDSGLPFPHPLDQIIRFEDVSFTYPGRTEPTLDHISLELRPGEKVALVGVNGAGKSTLIKLLLGLYTPTAGRITVGGIDLARFAPESLRRHVSCVFQDFARFDMSVRDNVAAGRLGATAADVEAAAASAGAAGFIDALPGGYEALLGKSFPGGVELSGGQWQRIALARAFLRDASLLVLDEPTAALDARAELELFGRFVELVQGRTALLTSHRLGVARLADRIVVMDGGRIAESGSHDELVAAGGIYAGLFQLQAQWYEEGQVALV